MNHGAPRHEKPLIPVTTVLGPAFVSRVSTSYKHLSDREEPIQSRMFVIRIRGLDRWEPRVAGLGYVTLSDLLGHPEGPIKKSLTRLCGIGAS